MLNKDRIYLGMLATLAALAIVSAGLLLFIAGASTGGVMDVNLPDWSLFWVAAINGAYGLAIIIVLCSRQFKSTSARRLTRLLNFALLPALPGGTLVGIYGLWTVDQPEDRAS